MSTSSNKETTGWFQFPGFDIMSLLAPNPAFAPLQNWLKEQKFMDMPASWPTPFAFQDFSKSGMEWYTMATEQMQTAFDEYWKMLGLVPQTEYDRLLQQYNAIKRKLEEEEQKKRENGEQDKAKLKETQEALKAAQAQIEKLESDMKKAGRQAETKAETKKEKI